MAYAGPIEVGMGFLWEPKLPYAREAIVVAEFVSAEDRRADGSPHEYEGIVRTFGKMSIGNPEMAWDKDYPNGLWNDEGRFREAVTRCEALDQ